MRRWIVAVGTFVAGAGLVGGAPAGAQPVDLTDTSERQIIVEIEVSGCDQFLDAEAQPVGTGTPNPDCTDADLIATTARRADEAGAMFTDPMGCTSGDPDCPLLPGALAFDLGAGVATVTLTSEVIEAVIGTAFDTCPTSPDCFTDYVIEIDLASGNMLNASFEGEIDTPIGVLPISQGSFNTNSPTVATTNTGGIQLLDLTPTLDDNKVGLFTPGAFTGAPYDPATGTITGVGPTLGGVFQTFSILADLRLTENTEPDSDGDNVADNVDNCIDVPNTGQDDTDADLYGNACDCDFDGGDVCDINDFQIFLGDFISGGDGGSGTDMNGDGVVDINDFQLFLIGFLLGFPGPSALVVPF